MKKHKTDSPRGARPPSHEETARVAYQIWKQNGEPEGQEWQNWFEAEQHIDDLVHRLPLKQKGLISQHEEKEFEKHLQTLLDSFSESERRSVTSL